jgi:Acetyltransferase (GNAT) domain
MRNTESAASAAQTGEYEVREYRSGDEHSLLETFNQVFAGENPNFRPRTMEEWRWGALQNPAGLRIWLGLHAGQVVSQYAAWPMRVWWDGGVRHCAQIVDSMVHPAHRGGLKRPGLFVRTAWPFFDAYGGVDKDLVHYGMPIDTAWRIGRTFLEYEALRTHGLLGRPVGAHAVAGPLPRFRPAQPCSPGVDLLERFDEQVHWLYQRCMAPWGLSTIRDQLFMSWRFVDRPGVTYQRIGVRDAQGILRGLLVLRHMDWVLPNLMVIADCLVPPDEPECMELLLAAAEQSASAAGASALVGLLPEWSPWFAWFQRRGFLVHPSDYFMVVRSFHPRIDSLWLRDAWWYQLADTDLV